MLNRAIDPTPESIKQLVAKVPAETPVVMLNLLRYRERADYPADKGLPSCSGREAYAAYGRAIQPHLAKVGGRMIWQGAATHAVIAPPGEQWDEVLLVSYPTRDAFLAMVKSPEYQAITFHRTAALEDSRLVATTGSSAIG